VGSQPSKSTTTIRCRFTGMSGQASLFEKKRAVQRPEGQPDEVVRLQPLPLGDETAKSMNTAIR